MLVIDLSDLVKWFLFCFAMAGTWVLLGKLLAPVWEILAWFGKLTKPFFDWLIP